MDKKQVAERLKYIRTMNNLTQEKFCEKLGLGIENYRSIEQGKNNLTIDNAIQICKEYGVSLDYIYRDGEYDNELFKALLDLRKYFKLSSQKLDNGLIRYRAEISEAFLDFLIEYDNAEKICKENDLPDIARSTWLDKIKAEHKEKYNKEQDKAIEFSLAKTSEIKEYITGVPVSHPPI